MVRFDYVERRFSRLFSMHIVVVNRRPWPFLVVPVLLTLVLGSGLRLHGAAFVKDNLELYTPVDAVARSELGHLETLFYINDSDPFYASRRYDTKRTGYIIVTAAEEDEDVLNPAVLSAAMHLWSVVQAMTVEFNKTRFNYQDMCVKFPMPPEFRSTLGQFLDPRERDKFCISNPLVEIFKLVLNAERPLFKKSLDEVTLGQIGEAFLTDSSSITQLLGGVSFDERKRISGAKAILLPYALRHTTLLEGEVAEQWELKLVDYLLAFNSPYIRTSWWTYETLAAESARDREKLTTMLVPCFVAVAIYTIVACCVKSWVRSRPWLAVGGVLNAAMAVISAVGLLLFLGCRITSIAYSMPFIVFSVGVDNVFILLSAWRTTRETDSLEDRLSKSFGDAAVSITVTSLTDLISFLVGCYTPFPSVQMFCVYAVAAVLFTYVYLLSFFAAVMVYTSRREVERRHCLSFSKVPPTAATANQVVPTFPPVRYIPTNFKKPKVREDSAALFFRETYSTFLLHPYTKAVVVFAFIFYLMTAIYGCMHLKIGMDPNDLLPSDSYGKKTLKIAEKYFGEYGSYLHVWMYSLSTLRLTHRKLWTYLYDEIRLYEHTEFTKVGDCWIRAFLEFVERKGLELNQTSFVPVLSQIFLKQPQFFKYKRDVRFVSNGTLLEASRVPIQLRFVGAVNQTRAMHMFRHLAETSDVPTKVYADFFLFAEQYNAVLPGTLSSIAMAALAVIFVSLVLIPEPLAALWVTLTIVSINVGILGFMNFCDIRLDFISMVTIVMSIGFCVDFAAHLAYHYAKGADLASDERVREALHTVGMPIIQSASSTLLGISFMFSTESYVFRSFLKTIFLVIGFGVIHGLVILPVFLSMLNWKRRKEAEKGISFAPGPVCYPPIDHKQLPRMDTVHSIPLTMSGPIAFRSRASSVYSSSASERSTYRRPEPEVSVMNHMKYAEK